MSDPENPISRSALEGTLHCTNCGDELTSERVRVGLLVLHARGVRGRVLRAGRRRRPRGEQGVRPIPLAPSPRPARAPAAPGGRPRHARRARSGRTRRRRNVRVRRRTASRIARLEAELDAALAAESDPARRRKLVDDHNAKLRRLNIRYRRSAQRERQSRGRAQSAATRSAIPSRASSVRPYTTWSTASDDLATGVVSRRRWHQTDAREDAQKADRPDRAGIGDAAGRTSPARTDHAVDRAGDATERVVRNGRGALGATSPGRVAGDRAQPAHDLGVRRSPLHQPRFLGADPERRS